MSKREEILAVALALFSRYGYGSVGIDRIIAESGVAKMTLYKQFGTKDGLVREVLVLRDRLFIEDLQGSVDAVQGGIEKVTEIFEWHRRWFNSPGFHGCMFIKASEEFSTTVPAITDVLREHKIAIQNMIARCLESLDDVDVPGMTAMIFVCLEGLTIHANMFRTDQYVDPVLTQILNLLTEKKKTPDQKRAP
ncbi:TetR/AcrR family transcriptional regulator [Pseudomonas sp. 3A(2025)]